MQHTFEPAIKPPQQADPDAHCFAFKGDQLLVCMTDSEIAIPTLGNFRNLDMATLSEHYLGTADGRPCYAMAIGDDALTPARTTYRGLRQLVGAIDESLFWVGGRAVQVVAWDRDHQFCGRCGTRTISHDTDRARQCPACNLIAYPRLSPAIIVRVEKGRAILLARNHRFSSKRHSVLAGFVDPGETLEHAVAREVREEVGIEVTNILYFGSQPWPFPNSLMLAFTADYVSGNICLQEAELASASWFLPEDLPELPPSMSIARRLIDAYLNKHGGTS